MRSKSLSKVSRWLRKKFPTRTPVQIRVVKKQPNLHGIVFISEERALIRITQDTDALMGETLLEEWAHVLRSECPLPLHDDHDALFWAILAAITKEYRGE
jgi:hypothetical protein